MATAGPQTTTQHFMLSHLLDNGCHEVSRYGEKGLMVTDGVASTACFVEIGKREELVAVMESAGSGSGG